MDVSLEVNGLEKALKKLRDVEQSVSIKTMRSAQRFAMRPAIDRAKQLVPNSGNSDEDGFSLRDAIGLRAETKKNRAGNATSMRFGAMRETTNGTDPSGYAIKGGLGKSSRSPIYDQIIHKDTPFLMDALEQTQAEVVARFGQKIIERVNKL